MSRRERNYLLGSVVVSALCAIAAHYLAGHYGSRNRYVEPIVAVLVFSAGFVLEPVRDAVKILFQDFPVARCNVLLFGPPGNGKTQVFRLLQGLPFRTGELATTDFTTASFFQRAGTSNARFKVTVADYAGQEPYTILSDIAPGSFFGGRYSRKIDVIFFIADLLPVRPDKYSNKPISDDLLVAAFKDEGLAIVTERTAKNMEYFNPWLLQILFTKVWSQKHRPYTVMLLINKVDLLADAVKAGHLKLPDSEGPEGYALKSYSELKDLLKKNCNEVGIRSFTCEPLSCKEDNGRLQQVLKQILEGLAEREP